MPTQLRSGVILFFSPLCLLVSLMPDAWPDYSWALRACGVATWTLGTLLQWQRKSVGTAWILGTIVILFYCFFPLSVEFATLKYPAFIAPTMSWRPFLGAYGFYFRDSSAELWVWRFVLALGIILLVQAIDVGRMSNPHASSILSFRDIWLYRGFLAGTALISLLLHLIFPARYAAIHDIVFPLSLFALGFAALGRIRGNRDSAKDLVIGGAVMATCITPQDGKLFFFFTLGLLPPVLMNIRKNVNMGIPLVLVASIMTGVIVFHNLTDIIPGGGRETFETTLFRKIFTRQYITLRCYNGALIAPETRGEQMGALPFFGSALIPRVLWPQKPSLSRGQDYTDLYCGKDCCQTMVASITTLGEPWLHGGTATTLVAIGMICTLLLAVDMAIARAPLPLGAIALALNAWILDFDLHFSLWLALVVKGTLLMLPPACWLLWRQYRSAYPHAQ